MKFFIIVTGYNCEAFVKKCHDSILAQTYDNWKAIFYNDASEDGTEQALNRLGVKYYDSQENLGAAYGRNLIINGESIDKGDVIVFLGMDDELLPNALETIKEEYDRGAWMTYGNWINQHGNGLPENFNLEFDEETHKNRDYRKVTYRSTAPNTFKKFLFDQLTEDDFKYKGEWLKTCTETNAMFSFLEMCGKERIGIIMEPIYMYNQNRPNNSITRFGREYKDEVLRDIKSRPKKDLFI